MSKLKISISTKVLSPPTIQKQSNCDIKLINPLFIEMFSILALEDVGVKETSGIDVAGAVEIGVAGGLGKGIIGTRGCV